MKLLLFAISRVLKTDLRSTQEVSFVTVLAGATGLGFGETPSEEAA
jgi:hypothetical protein